MCYVIVLMSSLLLYNVENNKELRKNIKGVGMSKLLTGTVYSSKIDVHSECIHTP